MDALLEFLVQIIIEVIGEFVIDVLFDGAAKGVAAVLARRRGRFILGFVVGLGFGCFWGGHLSGGPHYPRLLWVSLALGGLAGVAALRRGVRPVNRTLARRTDSLSGEASSAPERPRRSLSVCVRDVVLTWDSDRLVSLAVLNVGLALGVILVFRRG